MNKKKNNKTDNKKKLLLVSIIGVVLIAVIGITYAWLTQVLSGTKVNRITAGTLDLVLDDTTSNGINIDKGLPQSDSQGKENDPYTFKVINNGSLNAEYKLYLEDEEIENEEVRITDDKIKYSLKRNNKTIKEGLVSTSLTDGKREIESAIIKGGNTNNYSLVLWIDSEATTEDTNKVFKARIKLEAIQTEKSKYQVTYQKDNNITSIGKESDECTTVNGASTCTVVLPEITASGSPTLIGWYNGSQKVGNAGSTYTLRSDVVLTAKVSYVNQHIKAVYRYNQNGTGSGTSYTGCLGGEEAGCMEVVFDENTTYNTGDIIKYEVKDGTIKYFNVLYDKGNTLIMQHKRNTIYSTAWYSSSNNTKGPTTILPTLEAATADWQYVNNQTYTAGQTVFGTGEFATANTACTSTEGATVNAALCSGKKYANFTKTNVKARMITAQEAGQMGCKIKKSDSSTNMSCMKFMNNYLYASTNHGGTIEDDNHTGSDHNYGYWTMTANLSDSTNALFVSRRGYVTDYSTAVVDSGARAVVVVNK